MKLITIFLLIFGITIVLVNWNIFNDQKEWKQWLISLNGNYFIVFEFIFVFQKKILFLFLFCKLFIIVFEIECNCHQMKRNYWLIELYNKYIFIYSLSTMNINSYKKDIQKKKKEIKNYIQLTWMFIEQNIIVNRDQSTC